MTDLDTASAPAETETVARDAEPKAGRVKETNYNGSVDEFAVAFNSAKDEIETEAAKHKPGPKPGSKKAAEKPAEKPTRAKADEAGADEVKPADRSYAGDGDEDEDTAPAKVKPDPKAPREAKKYWSKSRQEAFRLQPREVQDEWLEAEPEPDGRWPTDTREAFAKLPRDAKEVVLAQLNEADRGLAQKFQALAAERRLAEDIRNAVPAPMRAHMQQRGLSEPQVFAKLLGYQHEAMTDPVGYVRRFIVQNKLNPAEVLGAAGQQNGQTGAMQADVMSHPAVRALKAEYDALQHSIAMNREQHAQEEARRFATEFEGVTQETDGEGNSLYPYIRLLADPMARIIESDPELFSSMATKEKFATAYRLALQEFPELSPPRRTAKSPPADEQEDEPAQAELEEKRAAKLEKAITPKSRTPQTVPAKGKAEDPLDAALEWAVKKQTSKR